MSFALMFIFWFAFFGVTLRSGAFCSQKMPHDNEILTYFIYGAVESALRNITLVEKSVGIIVIQKPYDGIYIYIFRKYCYKPKITYLHTLNPYIEGPNLRVNVSCIQGLPGTSRSVQNYSTGLKL